MKISERLKTECDLLALARAVIMFDDSTAGGASVQAYERMVELARAVVAKMEG